MSERGWKKRKEKEGNEKSRESKGNKGICQRIYGRGGTNREMMEELEGKREISGYAREEMGEEEGEGERGK